MKSQNNKKAGFTLVEIMIVGAIIGILMLIGWTAALWYHFLNGIRHLFWDAGYGFELPTAHASGRFVFIGTAALTVLTWLVILFAR